MKLQALIFDVDGTLAETERDAHRVGFNVAFEEAGLPDRWDPELYGELLAIPGGKERISYYWTQYKGKPEPDPAFVAKLHARKREVYTECVRAGQVPPRSGVLRLIREAQEAGVRLAIATTTSRGPLMELLRYTLDAHAPDWFDEIIAGDEVAAKKPDPEVYYRVLAELGLSARACLALEDSALGAQSALAAGIPVIVTPSEYTRDQDFTGALAVFDRLGEPEEQPARVLSGGIALPDYEAVDLATLRHLHCHGVLASH